MNEKVIITDKDYEEFFKNKKVSVSAEEKKRFMEFCKTFEKAFLGKEIEKNK
jgi:hypothetical protein